MQKNTITSFFKQVKRKSEDSTSSEPKKIAKSPPGPKEPAKSKEPVEVRDVAPGLDSFRSGNSADPNFYDNPRNLARHQKFIQQLVSKYSKGEGLGRRSMKPYDLQFIDLKTQHKDSILMIQNGYKYQILGEDAFKSARVLGRSPVPGWRTLSDEGDPSDSLYDRFASLTFPLERLPFYVEKIVAQGFKVSVAKQLETTALKAQGGNKKGPFKREVTDTYTKGTMVEELTANSAVSGHIMALNINSNQRVALIAVQTATGDLVYDVFDDSSLFMDLETRILHIQPSEILVIGELSGAAKKMIESLDCRIVPMNSKPVSTTDDKIGLPSSLPEDELLTACWLGLDTYLAEFKLTKSLDLEAKPFSLKSYMYLSGTTLNSLEIFENQTTNSVYGSLFWSLDVTQTAFGKRQLRQWVGQPLLNREKLAERVEAVEELMHNHSSLFSELPKAMAKVPDLERYTLQIYHGRIQPKQFYWYLYFFDALVSVVTEPQIAAANIKSPLVLSLLQSLVPVRPLLRRLLGQINGHQAKNYRDSNNLAAYFLPYNDETPSGSDSDIADDLELIDNLQMDIGICRSDFDKFLRQQSKELGAELKEARVYGEEDTFVIGVPKKDVKKIPSDWRRQGAITSEVRFWAPYSIEQTKVLKPLLERLQEAANAAYSNFIKHVSTHFDTLRQAISAISTIDCLFSLANVSSRPMHVKPDFVDAKCLEICDGRHPMLDQTVSGYIPNDTHCYENKNRLMVITGANMGGKSSYVRQVALLAIMAQIGCYVPATKCRLSLMDAVYTRMGAFDNLLRGESTFMIELKECAAIMANATPNSLVILDEIGRGTSTMDGVAIADAVLRYMSEEVKSFTLFITHYPSLCKLEQLYPQIMRNWSMDCMENNEEVTFLYKIVDHPASKSYGINVARLAELPQSVLDLAISKASELESEISMRSDRDKHLLSVLRSLNGELPLNELETLVESNTLNEIPDTQPE